MIKTVITGADLQEALARQQRWVERQAEPRRSQIKERVTARLAAEKLRMAKASLKSGTS